MTSPAQEPLALIDQVAEATTRLLDTVASLSNDDLLAASLLPGWTRGHVLAHIARNADSLVNLLLWAHTGVETPQYASQFIRDHDIEAGSTRPVAEQLVDIESSATRWSALAHKLPATAWSALVRTRAGREIPAYDIPWMRLQEVEIHHVDLGCSYTPADWPEPFLTRLLPGVTADLSAAQSRDATTSFAVEATDTGFKATIGATDPTSTVTGPAPALAAWLLGRSPGTDLPTSLPPLPAWR
ncbi:maleylpyruvate isomerase family mycothiol-dependent enzyme [Nocardia arizonensis]|uniref:maleylpyruvate isomerase family mycothiol-dependent enzyme n=1 Tax=Nocardia arizonensis TaxID=1141647 RepID=UPI0006D133B6|nr:maleylpyruvate isomerase family mycothiol-dependent enzyme [Nocardia arizonensis]